MIHKIGKPTTMLKNVSVGSVMGTDHHARHPGQGAAVAKTRGPRSVSGGTRHVKPGQRK